MHGVKTAAVAAALLIPGFALHPRLPTSARRLPAEVRFADHLTSKGTWTVMSNGAPLFVDVANGTTTAYVPVNDTISRLGLRRSGSDSIRASTAYRFVAGSYYTITADYRNGGNIPVLSVMRDRPPGDTMPALR